MAFQWHQICLRTFPLDFAIRRRKHFRCFAVHTQLSRKSSRTLFILLFHSKFHFFPKKRISRDCEMLETIFPLSFNKKCDEEKENLPHISTLEIFFLSPQNSLELSFRAKKNSMNNLVFRNYENCATICVARRRKANFVWQIAEMM